MSGNIIPFPVQVAAGGASAPPCEPPAAYPAYRALRKRGLDHWAACEGLARLIERRPDHFADWAYDEANRALDPTSLVRLVVHEAGDNGWDQNYRAEGHKAQFDPDLLKARYLEAQNTYTRLCAAWERVNALPFEEPERKRLATLYDLKERAYEAYRKADNDYRAHLMEQPDQGRIQAIYEALFEQYKGLGPHYAIMCRALAEHQEWSERIHRSGRQVDPGAVLEIQKSMRDWIKQMQAYTEATKSESISKETQEYIKICLKIVEDVVAPQAPRAWQEAMHELRKRLTVRPSAELPALASG